ncbi:hypothetical protein [Thiocapsa marina]|uniref:Uncharacterized protein n=1 Tax=Thiocapsa marina 5811 TaxID=768671 RepID=F9U8S4_9GAMM|nr:hypothetical protein [Thiocapsa marina]EGV19182.1 hypothetical protein ThimaDRAFT_1326 [Thiocapsa marina 5811]
MSPKNLPVLTIGPLLLAIALAASAEEEVSTDGIDVDVRQSIDENPQGRTYPGIDDVQDLGDGITDEGGFPDVLVDPRDAALEDEKNLGPNAPGYIP